MHHTDTPVVSERHEGKPWFAWTVAVMMVVSAVLAFLGYVLAATVVISATAIATGIIRLVLRERSPWKVRSVAIDSFIGIMLGVGLIVTYLSILFLD